MVVSSPPLLFRPHGLKLTLIRCSVNRDRFHVLMKMAFVYVQDFKEKVEQSFESTGSLKQPGRPTKVFDFDKMGERHIIMGPDELWTTWQNVFTKHESGGLWDIESSSTFKDAVTASGAPKMTKFSPITTNQMKALMGMDDAAIVELGHKLLATPPKVFLKRPSRWTSALPFTVWCTNKKHKTVLVKEIVQQAKTMKLEEADGVVVNDAVDPVAWGKLKARLCIGGFHMWVLMTVGDKWLRNEVGSGKKTMDMPKRLIDCLNAVMQNDRRFLNCKKCFRASMCRWIPELKSFDPELAIYRRERWTRYISGPASTEYCEVGIMDFRQFPKFKKTEVTSGYAVILNALKTASRGTMSTSVHTWMLIFSTQMAGTVDIVVKEFFPDHKLRRQCPYVYCKGEPTYSSKHKDKVMYLQRISTAFKNSRVVDSSSEVPKLSPTEDEPLHNEIEAYKSREICRHDFPDVFFDRELRYEVYIRFIDKFCRDQGTVMLVFAGSKAISACSVSAS